MNIFGTMSNQSCSPFKIVYSGSQINTVKDMKEQILKIAKDLEQGTITDIEAQNLLSCLFGVSGSFISRATA